MANVTYAHELLQQGKIVDALLEGGGVLGDFLALVLIMIVAIGVYNKTESPEATGYVVFLMALMGFLWSLSGEAAGVSIYVIFILIMVAGLALPLYNLLKRD